MFHNPDLEAVLSHAAKAPPIPAPTGKIVRIDNAVDFVEAVDAAEPGSTLLLADGEYFVPRDCQLTADDVTIRSASGNRDAVVLDGLSGQLSGPENNQAKAILRIKRAQRATIADITIRNTPKYGILFYGDSGVHDLTVYNVVFRNIWARGLKGTHPMRPDDREMGKDNYPPEKVEEVRPRNGQVRYCLFIADHIKTDRNDSADGDYISGTDMMGLNKWTLADNVFVGLRGFHGGGRGAIFVWHGCNDVVCERNLFINCDRGISFGNFSGKDVSVQRGIIRDNAFIAGTGKAVECCTTRNANVYNNRIFATDENRYYAVQFLAGNDGGRFHHNLVHGEITCDNTVTLEANHIGKHFGEYFNKPWDGDLGLTEKGAEFFGDWKRDA